MPKTISPIMIRMFKTKAFGLLLGGFVALILRHSAQATSTVSTLANAAVSADSAAAGTYVTLTGPALTEGSGRDVATGTIVLSAPAGFAFDTSASVSVGSEKT